MDYVKPFDVATAMINAGEMKAGLAVRDLLIRSFLSGALLAFATAFALTAALQANTPIVGALVFPVGFAMIVLLSLELVTGSFALVPLAALEGRRNWSQVGGNLCWVFLGNLLGSLFFGGLLTIALTNMGATAPSGVALKIIAAAEAKTTAYAALGVAGLVTVFVKAVLCNWMVCFGVVMPMTSHSTIGKIAACWLPIVMFFGLGFEHAVVNMFLIPTGMLLGAHVSLSDWWLWNQIPVTLGNLVGGLFFTGFLVRCTYRSRGAEAVAPAIAAATGIVHA